MHRFLLGHGSGNSADAILEDCLGQLGDIPAEANLGFIYATDALVAELPRLLQQLRQATGIERWTGTVGVGISATRREYYDEPALAIMLASFDESCMQSVPNLDSNIDAFIDASNTWLQRDQFHFGILHADPSNPATPQLMTDLAAQIPGAYFVGGLSSSNGENLQIADGVTSGGVSGVLFNSEIALVTGHSQGCTPIADKHTVTACERNIVIELDGLPALEVFKQDVGDVIARDLQRVAGYIFAALPIRGSDTGDYMVRNLIGIDPENGLIAIGDLLETGDELMFCRRDGNSARDDMMRMLEDIRARIDGEPRGAVYYSCLGRGRYQFGDNSEELRFISDVLGDIPLVGFFANGEIFHNRLYGYTGVLTVFC